MNVKNEVSLEKIKVDAENSFRNGFFCCEALMSSIIDNFELNISNDAIAMASGMAVGVGRSGCICGAVNGGVLALGLFFGRTIPKEPKVEKCLSLTKELHDWFKKETSKNSLCCRVLTKEFDMSQGEHKEQCIRYTGLCAYKVAEIIVRELKLTNTDLSNV